MSDEEKQERRIIKDEQWAKCWDRLLDSLDVIVAKITSGRFLAITFDTIGYTAGVVICGLLAYKEIIEPAVFISVLGAYGLLVQKTRENYFGMRPPIETPKTPEQKS